MAIETLGDALDHGWKLHVRCAWGKRDAMKSIRECVNSIEIDMPTLVWTRGREFPIAMLGNRMKCPRCGSRRVAIRFVVPTEPASAEAQPSAHWSRRMTG